jgi:hypothetical protein
LAKCRQHVDDLREAVCTEFFTKVCDGSEDSETAVEEMTVNVELDALQLPISTDLTALLKQFSSVLAGLMSKFSKTVLDERALDNKVLHLLRQGAVA